MKFQLTALKKKKHLALVGESGTSNRLHSLRDWSIGLALAVLVFLGGVSYIAYDFYTQFITQTGDTFDESSIQYHPEKVRRYAEEYKRKEEAFSELNTMRSEGGVTEESTTVTPSPVTDEIPPTEAFLEGGVAGNPIAE